MFKGKEVVKMPKEIKVPVPAEPTYAPPVREIDIDAEDNFLSAHRRLKAELAEAKRLTNEALIEIKAQRKIIDRLEADLLDYEQCKRDCAALENLFQNIASLTDSFLKPKEVARQKIEDAMVSKVKEIIEEKHDGRGD